MYRTQLVSDNELVLRTNQIFFGIVPDSGYLRARQCLLDGSYGEIIDCCTNELANPLTPHKVESLLLRATLYQLRGESKKAMDDLTALINIEDCPLKVRW